MSKKILRFSATWCQPCKMLAKNLEAAQLEIPVEYVDIDSNVTLTDDYGIRGVPTLVLVEDGKEISRLVGVKTADELKQWATQ